MKRVLFLASLMVAVFLMLSLFILPEHRLMVGVVTAAYLAVLAVILRLTMHQYFTNAYRLIFCRRTQYVAMWALPFILLLFVSFSLLRWGWLSGIKADLSRDMILSLSQESEDYLSSLDSGVELIYVRPVTGDDERNLFNSIAGEFNDHTNMLSYRSLHPVINSTDYNELKKLMPTLAPGTVVVLSRGRTAIADKVNEHSLIGAIYRVRAGEQGVCVSKGRGEPPLDDLSQNGAGILSSILQDRGMVLVPVEYVQAAQCGVFILMEPVSELDPAQVGILRSYSGRLIVIGGTRLASVRELLLSRGIIVEGNIEPGFGRAALREYDGGLMIDRFSSDPVVSSIRGSVVVSSADQLSCSDCKVLAGVSSPGGAGSQRPVMVSSAGTTVFSGNGLARNFFMRFKGNSELMVNLIGSSIWQDYPVSGSMSKLSAPQYFAVSPKYLSMIFMVSVVVFPALILMLSIYCFRQNRSRSE